MKLKFINKEILNMIKQLLFSLAICAMFITVHAQKQSPTNPGNMNPIIPGYFADPTIKKFGDTYYIYATTDGNGGGLGPSQVWMSKDFVNWTFQDMNWPTTYHYWAPDVTLGNDGKYYMYYCQPVEVYGASSSSPVGPWTPLLPDNKPMIPNYFVPGVITLDAQTFKDDDGKFYMHWGTWGIYPDHGCGVGLMNSDMKTFAKTGKIPNTIAKDFFEAPFMFKRKGIYYLTYSSGACEDETYRVQYVMSKTGPMDGFVYGKNSPILVTNADKTVHGPGHQSVIQIGDEYYLVYHRHNNPNAGGGFHRQICIDRLVFDEEGNIVKLEPTHTGIGLLGKDSNPYPNQAYLKKVTASSYYNEDFKPEFAVDNNNGTLWKPAKNSTEPASLTIDLGKITSIKRVLTEFEYPAWYYQYKIEYSSNGTAWKIYADRSKNKIHGSPMIDDAIVNARYVRMTILGTENPGMYKALWNIKVYSDRAELPFAVANLPKPIKTDSTYLEKGLLIDIDANNFEVGSLINSWKNNGKLGGSFSTQQKLPITEIIGGKKAIVFNGTQQLVSSFQVPLSLAGNSSYTVAFWVFAKQIKDEAPVITWAFGGRDLNNAIFGLGKQPGFGAVQHGGFSDMPYNRKTLPEAGKWQQVVFTFDGTFEKIYLNGELNNQENKMLFVKTAKNFILGSKNGRQSLLNGALASLKVYDYALTEKEVKNSFQEPDKSKITVYLDASKLNYGSLEKWKNEGNAGGYFFANGTAPVVKDIAGKIAVQFTGNEKLLADTMFSNKLKMKDRFSIATGIYKSNGQWQYLINVYNGKSLEKYIDGELKETVSFKLDNKQSTQSLNGLLSDEGFTGAINNLIVYDKVLIKEEIELFTKLWKAHLHAPFTGDILFKQSPIAVSPNIVMMEAVAANSSNQLSYYFTRSNSEGVSEWQENPAYIDYSVKSNQKYSYAFKIKDHYGNVSDLISPITISTSTEQFNIQQDNFSASKNYLIEGTNGSMWTGLIGKGEKESALIVQAENQQLKLESKATNWDGNSPFGPFLYKEVAGDFVAEVMVPDVSGLAAKKVAGNNEVGLMLRLPNDTALTGRRPQMQLIQNGIFPAWNVGNLFTNFQNGRREQNNIQSSWNYNKYLQIQRQGNMVFVRSSKNGTDWVDMPGSPVLRNDLNGKAVQIGLYQSTYGPAQAYGVFANFKLIEQKTK
jgi:hypothetical protein